MEESKPIVLVVEVEESVRRLAVRVLERAGYEVRVSATAEDALGRFDRPGQQLDLLMSDVILPGRNGIELARRLRERFPSLKVLLVSGYDDRAEVRDVEAAADPTTSYLAKPFTSTQVVAAVRALLREER